jgi:nicotinamidase-related amidase
LSFHRFKLIRTALRPIISPGITGADAFQAVIVAEEEMLVQQREMLDADRSIVLVIDLQGKLIEMVHRSRLVIAATNRLMRLAEIFQVPVVLTEQYPQGLGPTHPEVRSLYDGLTSPKQYVEKLSFGCCGTPAFESAVSDLRPQLPAGRRQFIIAGIETHVCVMQTVLPLLDQGSSVHLCWEAVSGRGAEYRDWGLQRMQQAGAVISNHESVCFEWARTKEHQCFKDMNRILRDGQLTGEEQGH